MIFFTSSSLIATFTSLLPPTLSHDATVSPPLYPVNNTTHPPNRTHPRHSRFASSTIPSLTGFDVCTWKNPTSCSCQELYNSYATTYVTKITYSDDGGISTDTDDNGQISVMTVPAGVKTNTFTLQTVTDDAWEPPTACCEPCYLLAYGVQLLYWPIDVAASANNQSSKMITAPVPYTTVSDGFTLYACSLPPTVPC